MVIDCFLPWRDLVERETNSPNMSSDKVYVGLENAPHAFDVCGRVLGQGGANLEFIRSETGALVILKGGVTDKMNPLHLALSHSRPDQLASARQLALSLVESVRQEFQEWSRENQPKPAPVTIPPPAIVNQVKVPAPNVISSLPPPAIVAPVLAASPQIQQQQPQFLQLVPQQQIFVAQDGSQYIKVSPGPAQNIGPVTAMSMGQNMVMQPQQVQPQQMHPQQNMLQAQQNMLQAQPFSQPQQMQPNFSAQPAPQFQIMSGVASQPTVCSAPTLASGTSPMLSRNAGPQPWAQGPLQVTPAPVSAPPIQQTNVTPHMNTVPAWNQQQQQNLTQPHPWVDSKAASEPATAQRNPENLPWYQNSQNVPTSPVKSNENKAVEVRSEGAGSGVGSGKRPGWDSPANGQHGTKRKSNKELPDLREELKTSKDQEPSDTTPEGRRDYRRDGRNRDGRRERRRDEPYRKPQEDRPNEDNQVGNQGPPEAKRERLDAYNQVPPPQDQFQQQNRYQVAQNRPQENNTAPFNSKWDLPNRPAVKPANAYPQNNYQQQQQQQPLGQYQNYGQQGGAHKPLLPPPPPTTVDEKPVPSYQVVGQPTTYAQTNPWVQQTYDQKQTYNQQQQHPWNRPNASNPNASQYNQGRPGPWENAPPQRTTPYDNRSAPFDNQPPNRVTPFENQQQSYAWSGQY